MQFLKILSKYIWNQNKAISIPVSVLAIACGLALIIIKNIPLAIPEVKPEIKFPNKTGYYFAPDTEKREERLLRVFKTGDILSFSIVGTGDIYTINRWGYIKWTECSDEEVNLLAKESAIIRRQLEIADKCNYKIE